LYAKANRYTVTTFLPIVERELRVAARKRSTFWVRIIAALVAFVIGTGFLILTRVGWGLGSFSLGSGLFTGLTWLCLGAALAAGLFLTSDCLSEEKRAGTMGFLFLTDLRGYDVVFGKLLATSLRGVCALLGVLPILAITLLMGGVTGGQFWKTSLALLNALFLSLAAGLLVSAVCRESQKALGGTLFLLVLLVAAGPGTDAILAGVQGRAFRPDLSLLSPGFLFTEASAWGRNSFWVGLLSNQALGWSILVLACLLLPRTWQEKARSSAGTASFVYRLKFGEPKRRARLRERLMDVNPVFWLACRERWQALSLWVITILLAGAAVLILVHDEQSLWWMGWGQASGLLSVVLYLGCASQSARFFVEAQHSGVMELLLVSPLTVTQILQGQWRGLGRMFGLPLALFLAAECLGGFVVQERTWSRIPAIPPATTMTASNAPSGTMPGTNTTVTIKSGSLSGVTFKGPGFTPPHRAILMVLSVAGTCSLLANFVALVWFGMWMGLTSKTVNLATLKTIVFVLIAPWFVLSFASALLIPLLIFSTWTQRATAAPQLMMWFPWIATALATVLCLAKDVGFSLWARKKLYSEFRDRAMQVMAVRLSTPASATATRTPLGWRRSPAAWRCRGQLASTNRLR
jgi:ABC-2 family transporter protein